MRVALIASWPRSLLNFRGKLMEAMVSEGHQVTALAPDLMPGAAEKLAAIGVDFIPTDLQRTGMSPRADGRALVQLVRKLRVIQPDVTLGYTIKPVIYGSIAARIAGVPRRFSAVTGLGHLFIDDAPRTRVIRRIACTLYRTAFVANEAVFFQNRDDRDEFTQRGLLPQAKTVVVDGSGVDLALHNRVPAVTDRVVFLFMGRFLREKGLRELIGASRIVKARYPNVQIRLLGKVDDNPSSVTAAEIAAWEDEGLIENCGWQSDVRPFVESCSVFVLPSYREGTPRSVLEAMATGKPIITTDAPGCRETVRDGETGFLVPLHSEEALADAMLRFVADPALISSMGEASYRYCVERYDVHRVNRMMLQTMGLL